MSRLEQSALNVRSVDQANGVRLVLRGEIDLRTMPTLQRALWRAEEQRPRTLLLDLEQLTFVDAAGLRTILTTARRSQAAGARVALLNPSAAVRRLMSLTGNEHAVEVLSAASAVRAA